MAGCETCLLKRYKKRDGTSFCVEKNSYAELNFDAIATMGPSTPKPKVVKECDHKDIYKVKS